MMERDHLQPDLSVPRQQPIDELTPDTDVEAAAADVERQRGAGDRPGAAAERVERETFEGDDAA